MAKSRQIKNDTSPMNDLLDKQKNFPREGEMVEGTIVSIARGELYVDLDGLATGIVRGYELLEENESGDSFKVGDRVQVTVMDLENELGLLELSLKAANQTARWHKMHDLKRTHEVVKVPILEANKGGLVVKVGNVPGFLPVSQLTVDHYPRIEGGDKNRILDHLQPFIGQTFTVCVTDILEKENKVIVSERLAWEEQQKEVLSKYKVGDTITGTVAGLVDFGAFIRFGDGLEGLAHISELSWQRAKHPSEILQKDQVVEAKIIGLKGSRISLSLRALQPDPWAEVESNYKVGDKIDGVVSKLTSFGAFVDITPDIQALAHVSELSDEAVQDPGQAVEVGKSYKFTIIKVDAADHKMKLSLKSNPTIGGDDKEDDILQEVTKEEAPVEEIKEEAKPPEASRPKQASLEAGLAESEEETAVEEVKEETKVEDIKQLTIDV